MDEKRKGKLIYIVVVVPICLAELMAYCGCRVFIDILAYTYLIGGFSIALGTGLYCFYWKPFPLKTGESEDEISPEDSWRSFVISTRDNRRKQLIDMDIYVTTGLIGLIVFCTTLLPDAAKLKMPIVLAGVFIFFFLLFTHGWATWAYVREVKKCPSVRFSREEGVWLLEVTDEILHRLIQADVLGLFILVILIGRLFNLRY